MTDVSNIKDIATASLLKEYPEDIQQKLHRDSTLFKKDIMVLIRALERIKITDRDVCSASEEDKVRVAYGKLVCRLMNPNNYDDDLLNLKIDFKFVSAESLYEMDLSPVSYLVNKLLLESSLIYLAGPPGTFKTGYAIYLALCGACKDTILTEFKINRPFKTMFIDEENGLRRTKYKLVRLARGLGIKDINVLQNRVMFSCITGFKLKEEWVHELKFQISENQPDLVVIDNIARCFTGDERSEKDVASIQGMLKPIIEELNVSFVIIHHCKKPQEEYKKELLSLNSIRGSGDFGAQCDAAFLVDLYKSDSEHQTKIFKFYQLKEKDGMEMKSFNFLIDGDEETRPQEGLKVSFAGYITDNKDKKQENEIDIIAKAIVNWWMNGIDGPVQFYETSIIIASVKELKIKDKPNKTRSALKVLEELKIVKHHKKDGKFEWLNNQGAVKALMDGFTVEF